MTGHKAPPTLLHRLREHAATRPDAQAFAWLNDAGSPTETLTYEQLARRVDSIAAHLREATTPGDRAVLLYGPGLEFVSAFLGCLAAGVIAVPAYPPRNRRHHPRLDAIVHDAEPQVVRCHLRCGASTPSTSLPPMPSRAVVCCPSPVIWRSCSTPRGRRPRPRA